MTLPDASELLGLHHIVVDRDQRKRERERCSGCKVQKEQRRKTIRYKEEGWRMEGVV